MKKLLILLFSILISFNSYGEVELDFSSDTFCEESPKVQVRNNLYYLPNTEKPYSGKNLCVYLSNGQTIVLEILKMDFGMASRLIGMKMVRNGKRRIGKTAK